MFQMNIQYLSKIYIKKISSMKMDQSPKDFNKYKIQVVPPILKPKINNIGYGNPRYNSMLAYKDNVLLPCGSSLRLVDIKNNQILYNKQIGHSQIFQIEQNSKYILIVNFQGLLTLLDKNNLEIKYQLHAPGKQIRHLSFTEKRLVISCELSELEHKTKFCIFDVQKIQAGKTSPQHLVQGHFYLPQEVNGNDLLVIEYEDPNPKGRSRTETVLEKKLPIKHRLVRFTEQGNNIKQKVQFEMKQKGQIICAVSNGDFIFYLHPARRVTTFCNSLDCLVEDTLPSKSVPIMIEKFRKGFIWSSTGNQLTYAWFDYDTKALKYEQIKLHSQGVGGNLSIKPLQEQKGFFLYNQNGLHHLCHLEQKTYSQNQFQITNCGVSLNKDGSLVAVGDFAGNIVILQTHQHNLVPKSIVKINVTMPIRSLVWCTNLNIIVIGCVGGGIFAWKIQEPQPTLIQQMEHTVNILRYAHGRIFVGTSDGQVKVISEQTLSEMYKYKAHHPIQYQTEKQRQLFGSMKNYAEIWSLTIAPNMVKNQITIVSSSQDQTQKVFKVTEDKQHQLTHHLKGHQLAVTSIDWKNMGKGIGEIYVSCSDDKTVRFRDPKQNFKILFELETNTIKQWHTLTYLALEEGGTRVAIGSQNGYLFIFDIKDRKFLFGQKIHLGGIEGLDWKNGKLCTCSSDLCVSIMEFNE